MAHDRTTPTTTPPEVHPTGPPTQANRSARGPPAAEASAPWILLVEDDPDIAELGRRALAVVVPQARVSCAATGKQALAQLSEACRGQPPKRPDLVLLDLKLPGMDGTGVLSGMRADDDLAQVPVVVLSSSDAPRDIRRAYAAGADDYVVKPVDYAKLKQVVGGITDTWLSLPPTSGGNT